MMSDPFPTVAARRSIGARYSVADAAHMASCPYIMAIRYGGLWVLDDISPGGCETIVGMSIDDARTAYLTARLEWLAWMGLCEECRPHHDVTPAKHSTERAA